MTRKKRIQCFCHPKKKDGKFELPKICIFDNKNGEFEDISMRCREERRFSPPHILFDYPT